MKNKAKEEIGRHLEGKTEGTEHKYLIRKKKKKVKVEEVFSLSQGHLHLHSSKHLKAPQADCRE